MSEMIYRKNEAGEFEEIGWEFKGFPADGIWLVQDGKRSCITHMDDIANYPFRINVWMGIETETILEELGKRERIGGSVRETVEIIARIIQDKTMEILE